MMRIRGQLQRRSQSQYLLRTNPMGTNLVPMWPYLINYPLDTFTIHTTHNHHHFHQLRNKVNNTLRQTRILLSSHLYRKSTMDFRPLGHPALRCIDDYPTQAKYLLIHLPLQVLDLLRIPCYPSAHLPRQSYYLLRPACLALRDPLQVHSMHLPIWRVNNIGIVLRCPHRD